MSALNALADPALTPVQMLSQIASIQTTDAQLVLSAVSNKSTPGIAVISAVTLAQVQAAVGIRRPFNPYAY